MIHRIINIALVFVILLLLGRIIAYFIPWYKHDTSPLPIITNTGKEAFHPGETVPIEIHRTALVGMQGTVLRELVRLDKEEGVEYEVSRSIAPQHIEAGHKRIIAYYQLPTLDICPQLIGNTYVIRGTFTYSPFGLWNKTFEFTTVPFHIEVPKRK